MLKFKQSLLTDLYSGAGLSVKREARLSFFFGLCRDIYNSQFSLKSQFSFH